MLRTLFILNPNAGRRRMRFLIWKLRKYRASVDVRVTEYPGHASEIVRSGFDKYDVFIAVGGDGTINEIASELVGSDKILAVYPGGSGNGFAREFGFDKNVVRLMQAIESGKTIKVDVLRLNGNTSVHLSGVGYDSQVALDFSERKNRGFWNYVRSTIKIIWRYQPIEATIETKTETISGKFFMINIANNRQFGYNARISSNSNPTDGRFELVLVSLFPKLKFPFFSLKLFLGLLKPSKILRIIPCSEEVILSTNQHDFHIDGEPVSLDFPVKVEIESGKLNVVDTSKMKFY